MRRECRRRFSLGPRSGVARGRSGTRRAVVHCGQCLGAQPQRLQAGFVRRRFVAVQREPLLFFQKGQGQLRQERCQVVGLSRQAQAIQGCARRLHRATRVRIRSEAGQLGGRTTVRAPNPTLSDGFGVESRLGFCSTHFLACVSILVSHSKQYKLLQDGKPSSITRERVTLLEDLDFSWNAQVSAWARHLEDLKLFRSEAGHCCVPLNHPKFPKLGLWVKEQRRHYTLMKQGKSSHMTEGRAQQLDKVGFCWDTHEATWLERFRELEAFKDSQGHCLVSTNYTENPRLGTWVHHQRRQYKKFKDGSSCHITEERIRALEGLGFVWSTRDKGEASPSNCYHSESEDDLSAPDMRPGNLSFRPYKRPRLSSSCEEV